MGFQSSWIGLHWKYEDGLEENATWEDRPYKQSFVKQGELYAMQNAMISLLKPCVKCHILKSAWARGFLVSLYFQPKVTSNKSVRLIDTSIPFDNN